MSVSAFPYGVIAASGASGGSVVISGGFASDFKFQGLGVDAFAAWNFRTDGAVQRKNGSSWTTINGEWWSEQPVTGIGGDYEIRATLSSGTTPTGPTLGTWHALTSNREWSLTQDDALVGFKECALAVSIRDAATQTVLDTADYNIRVDVEP